MLFSKSNRLFNIGVHYLDDNKSFFQMKAKALGKELFECICQLLGLEEKDYFGLQFIDRNGNMAWLDNEKSLRRQIWHLKNRELLFRVKFYIADPTCLANEYTRYLFSLQIAIDLKAGFISGSDADVACMLSYILQADLGDYDQQNVDNIDLSGSLPACNAQITEQCLDFYKLNQGMLKSEADTKLLDKARKLPSYGKRFYTCESPPVGSTPLCMCTDHVGISIFEDDMEVVSFAWDSVESVVFKNRRLFVKYSVFGQSRVAEYIFDDAHKCRAYWKIVWESLSFYKDVVQQKNRRVGRSSFFKRGSRFRYSGRTLATMLQLENTETRANFERTHSNRISMNQPRRTTCISTPSREIGVCEVDNQCGEGADWSTPLITEQELNQIHGTCFGDFISLEHDVVARQPVEEVERTNNGQFRPIKRLLPLTEPTPALSSKRSLYLSSTASPAQNTESSRPIGLCRLASRGSMWSKRRLVKTNHVEIPRIYEIILELYASEKVYCKELASVAHDFRAAVESVLPEATLEDLTSQFIPLLEQHSSLFSLLTENLDQIHVDKLINCASVFFFTIFESFDIYSEYLRSFDWLLNTLMDALGKESQVAQTCSSFQRQLYMPLLRLFLRPIQQLYYYQLILDGVSSTAMSDDNHTLFHSISTKLDILLDEYDSKIQNAVEMLYLHEFSACIDESDYILTHGRKLVRIGVLTVDSTQRLAILFSDLIVFCEPVPGMNLFSLANKISLSNLEKLNVETGRFFMLVDGDDEIHVETQTIEDKHSWVADINSLLLNLPDVPEEASSLRGDVEPVHFSQGLLSTVWKHQICSLTFSDLFSYFKVTFAGSVYRQTKLSKQRFFVLLNNLCLYFFTDYSLKREEVPDCKHRMCVLPAEISMRSIMVTEAQEKYQFSIKLGQTTTDLCAESRYSQNRWAVSIESASV